MGALLFGAVIIVFYSYERFNRVTYEGGKRLERLVDLLSPDKLRAKRVVMQAWTFYTLALLLVYVVLCAYANFLPLIGVTAFEPEPPAGASQLPTAAAGPAEAQIPSTDRRTAGFTPGSVSDVDWNQPLAPTNAPAAEEDKGFSLGIPPSVSLTMALIIVGLAPSFPMLRRLEDWMRVTAHRLAGIPTRVLDDSDELRYHSIRLRSEDGTHTDSLLIPHGDWDRLDHYRKSAEGHLTAPEDFAHDLDLIFAVSAWILERKLKLDNARERQRFERLEDQLRKRKELLVLELDEKTDFALRRSDDDSDADAQMTVGGEAAAITEIKRGSWERLAADADDLADDLCILLAVYVQHEILARDDSGLTRTAADDTEQDGARPESVRQHAKARSRLKAFLGDILQGEGATSDRVPSFTITTWLWTLGAVIVFTLFWSVWLGRYEFELRWLGEPISAYRRALSLTFVALNGFGVSMIVALAIRDAGRQTYRWRNVWREHWTTSLPEMVIVLLSSWFFAMVFVVAVTFWQAAIQQGWGSNESAQAVRAAFEYNAPTMLRGSVLALVVVCLLDAHEARIRSLRHEVPWRGSLLWAAWAAAIMGVVGGVARYMVSWVVLLSNPRPGGIDDIDRGLVFYATIYSALIGFIVVFCVAEVLLHRWPTVGPRRQSRLRMPIATES